MIKIFSKQHQQKNHQDNFQIEKLMEILLIIE
jgi:hypothetical protein